MIGRITPILLLLVVFSLAAVNSVRGQSLSDADSARIHDEIANERPDLTQGGSARSLLLRHLRRGDYNDAEEVIRFMARSSSPDAPGWLTGAEELTAATIIGRRSVVSDPARLGQLLLRRQTEPRQHIRFEDGNYRALQKFLQENLASIAGRFKEGEPTDEEIAFFSLLQNHLFVRGLRGREELNRRATEFAAAHPASSLASLALLYIRVPYRESEFGFAFQGGYSGGRFLVNERELLGGVHGPNIGGEIYYNQATLVGNLTFATVNINTPFEHGGDEWRPGNAPFINATLDVGWELRSGRLGVVPMVGVALQSMSAPSNEYQESETPPETGGRVGLDISTMICYRAYPSDIGAHLDLRIRGGWTTSGPGGYDPQLGGSLWYVTVGVALVQRPYRGGE